MPDVCVNDALHDADLSVPPVSSETKAIAEFTRRGRTGDYFTVQSFPGKLRSAFPGSQKVEDLLGAAKKWTAGRFQTLRKEADQILKGLPGSNQARTLLDFIASSPADSPMLYRGMAMSQKADYVAAQWLEGSSFDLALGSFTSDVKVAARFAMNARTKSATQLIIRVEKGSRALKVEGMVGHKNYWREREWIGSGKYRITRVTKSGNKVTVSIRQEAVFGA